jgi:hypothetical protein
MMPAFAEQNIVDMFYRNAILVPVEETFDTLIMALSYLQLPFRLLAGLVAYTPGIDCPSLQGVHGCGRFSVRDPFRGPARRFQPSARTHSESDEGDGLRIDLPLGAA